MTLNIRELSVAEKLTNEGETRIDRSGQGLPQAVMRAVRQAMAYLLTCHAGPPP